MSLEDFEKWLYGSQALSDMMGENFVFDAFAFSYKQDGAKYLFEHSMSKYLDQDEFMLWKIKSNLKDLVAGKSNRDRILDDFYRL
ncbi:MAG: hypothetical protein WKF87_16300 [Chryseolinea sp.]